MFKINDKVYFRHNVWNTWYEGIIINVEKLAPDIFEYTIQHNNGEYYTRYSMDEYLTKESPENSHFVPMNISE